MPIEELAERIPTASSFPSELIIEAVRVTSL
jgi:hypothetical protein